MSQPDDAILQILVQSFSVEFSIDGTLSFFHFHTIEKGPQN
jgi:hypothetical protein